MLAKVAAFAAGVVFAPALMTALFRVLDMDSALPALAIAAVLVLVGVLRGGLLRWAALGFAVGVIGFEAVVVWALDKWGDASAV